MATLGDGEREQIRQWVHDLFERVGTTQRGFAELIGAPDHHTIRDWLNGKNTPSGVYLWRLLKLEEGLGDPPGDPRRPPNPS